MTREITEKVDLNQLSTEALKERLLETVEGRDAEPLNQKVLFYNQELEPLFTELSRRNPFPQAEDQLPLMPGVWLMVWSTIPYQDIFPGRIYDQSYQIFHDDGYYANVARYAPGHKLSILKKLSKILLAYDFMIIQKFEVKEGQWLIQNVGIEQAFRFRAIPLNVERAENWFTTKVDAKRSPSSTHSQSGSQSDSQFGKADKSTAKKFERISSASPQLEHLYIDADFRLVKSQREAKQRPSYTIAIRKR
ncbi:MAG: hypothetical protein HC840_07370 [Leptolyngbyaceae cyanobacterium RM2_2_4]|nr:hypothetical protein [Leptolyngbyaceae cyanobacterium SL_5_14]NJO49293.1 hypothetical protein [Leptolyngbyaceae cyanobacterium RM2_2_4]